MRIVHWLFLVSAALFVSGIGFLVVSARSRPQPAGAAEAPAITTVADTRRLMAGIVGPAANVVFEAVSTSVTAAGVEEKAPKNDEEWRAVGNSAAALAESGNLLMMGSRVVDADWVKLSRAMVDAGALALKATEAKDANAVLAAGEAVNISCDRCHEKYRRGGG